MPMSFYGSVPTVFGRHEAVQATCPVLSGTLHSRMDLRDEKRRGASRSVKTDFGTVLSRDTNSLKQPDIQGGQSSGSP